MSHYFTFPTLAHYVDGHLADMVKSAATSLREFHRSLSEARALEIAAAILAEGASTEFSKLERKEMIYDAELASFYEAVLSRRMTPNCELVEVAGTRTLLDDMFLLRERGLAGLINYRPEHTL